MNLKKKCIEKYAIEQIEVNLIVFEIIVVVAFQNNFHLKMYQNNFFYFLKFIIKINTSK